MKESLDQQAGHRPAPWTGSRQVGQSCGSATSTTSPKLARTALLSRAKRLAGTVSPCMDLTLTPQVANLNGVAGDGPAAGALRRRLCAPSVVMKAMVSSLPLVFDRRRQRAYRRRAATLGPSTFLIERVAEDLSDRLATVLRRFECALDLGTPTDAVRRALAAIAGGDTLTELRQAFAAAEAEIEDGISPRVVPFSDVRDMGALLQRAGFALPVTDIDRVTARYASPISLMHDLRRMGATNPLLERSRRPLKRATLRRMTEVYAERFADR